eukprot:GHVS01007971.1.p1 GENE.GHVS01007971.1~~GHVS01007971.1.p1  ORF type:complete len:421 (-),score=76.14 GHVS01007971.1:121-1383(-)
MEEKSDPFKVVLASVTNLMYPVDIDLMHFLFSKYGTVEKIVTFSKSPTMYQALVQFAYHDQAKNALMQLHNRNIYDGCNTLQIQPSRLQELVVKNNNNRSMDYTTGDVGNGRGSGGGYAGGGGVGLLNTPGGNSMTLAHGNYGAGGAGGAQQLGGGGMGQMGGMGGGPMGGGGFGGMGGGMNMARSAGAGLLAMVEKVPKELRELDLEGINTSQTPVVICYNLSPTETTVQKLFNLFSLYGTVTRIKILREKNDTALIQFSDPLYASIAHSLLNNAPINGRELQISFSKNHEVKMPPQSNQETEEDLKRTKSFGLKDQRYGALNSAADMEKYVKGACRPTNTLFIANINEECTEEDITKLFVDICPINKFLFKDPREGSRTRMAMVEVPSDVEAIRALMGLHNTPIGSRSIKVAFSKTVL